MSGEKNSVTRAALTMVLGVIIVAVGYMVAPNMFHISDTYFPEAYMSLLFLLVGSGFIVVGMKKLID